MQKIPQKITALFLSILFSLPAIAETDAKQLLDNMLLAKDKLNYEIAFVQTTPSNMDSFRYRHIKQGNKTYAQLVTLDGEQQEIIQRDNLISYFQPNAQAFTINSANIVDALPAVMRSNFNRLSEYYEFVKLRKSRVAGRFTDTIRIVPKDDFRYQYLVFVDEENHLLLRADMLDREGNLLDQFRVVTLYIDDQLKGLADYLNKVSIPPLLNDNKSTDNEITFKWQPMWLPQGFTQISSKKILNTNGAIETRLFSDGLFTFNLSIATTRSQSQENTWRQGAYTIYSETHGDKEITFIGQLPIAAAKRIVKEVTFSP
ncbi:sigma-E factor regulatory protein RseB [Rodentibacter caecimuris]|uniref:Sigma-E factor regulatory protein RseB n=1 Tax=Rodentibacter caecimuris TaxID=1796644 RepID=A0ABX3KWJ8_9PAST|nr:sigma-E factor regulatory protein RseB [Rodentibacter heylii]